MVSTEAQSGWGLSLRSFSGYWWDSSRQWVGAERYSGRKCPVVRVDLRRGSMMLKMRMMRVWHLLSAHLHSILTAPGHLRGHQVPGLCLEHWLGCTWPG